MTPPLFIPVLGRALYPGASVALDFTRNLYRSGTPVVKGSPSLLPGWTFTRASTGYAETAAGALVAFASGAPRITDKGLLVEEARTNLLLRSQEFDNASWTKLRCSITADAAVAPDGTTTADAFVEDGTAASNRRAVQVLAKAASAITYTQSCYLKAGARNYAVLYSEGAAGTARTYFNIANGTISTAAAVTGTWTSPSATITALANGWYRCTQTWTTDTGTYADQYIFGSADGSTLNYNGVNGQVGFYMWGAQLELGAFPTSYIPTTTASATRAADVAWISGLSLTYPLTTVLEWVRNADTGLNEFLLQTDAGDSTNRAYLTISTADTARMQIVAGGVAQMDETIPGAVSLAVTHKVAGTAATNNGQHAIDGSPGSLDAVVTAPATATFLRIATESGSTVRGSTWVRRALVYPSQYTQAQLIAATT